MIKSGISVLVILMFFSTAIPGCLESTCDITGEIDNSYLVNLKETDNNIIKYKKFADFEIQI